MSGVFWNRTAANPLSPAGVNFDAQAEGKHLMVVSVANLSPIIAIVAGVLILVMPRLLNYIVAIYLILVGILGLGIIR
jgi:uncharacterized membrane protein